MKIRNTKEQLIESKIRGLELKNYIWCDVFKLISTRLNESLQRDGYNIEIIKGKACHAIELSLTELDGIFEYHSRSSLRLALRALSNHGYILGDTHYCTPGTPRIISSLEFVIPLTPEQYNVLCRMYTKGKQAKAVDVTAA